jgi:TIR domain
MSRRIQSCFISAPLDTKIDNVRASLMERGLRVFTPFDISAGARWQDSVVQALTDADLFIAIITHDAAKLAFRSNVLIELGIAMGLQKQLVVFAPPKSDLIPSDLRGVLVVRTSLQNREAIDFTFDQLLAAPDSAVMRQESHQKEGRALGPYSSALLANVADDPGSELSVETALISALRESGVELVVERPGPDRGFDLVVWSDNLQSTVGNPFPIEIKRRITSKKQAQRTLTECARAAKSAGAIWSLLVFVEGPKSDDPVWLSTPNVLALSFEDLIREMGYRPFDDVIRRLRNHRAHGGSF